MFPIIRCSWTDYVAHIPRNDRKIKRCKIVGFDHQSLHFACLRVKYCENNKCKQKLVSPISIAAIQLLWWASLAASEDDEKEDSTTVTTFLPPLETSDLQLVSSSIREQFAFCLYQTNLLLNYRFIEKQVLMTPYVLTDKQKTNLNFLPCSWTGFEAHIPSSNCHMAQVQRVKIGLFCLSNMSILIQNLSKKKSVETFESSIAIAALHICWWDKLVVSEEEEEEEEEEEVENHVKLLPEFEIFQVPPDAHDSCMFLMKETNQILAHVCV